MNKKIHIIGGGTLFHLASHLALCAPAYGSTPRKLAGLCRTKTKDLDTELHLTRMAGGNSLETNNDIAELIKKLTDDPATKIIFLPAALCDYETDSVNGQPPSKYGKRLRTRIETEVNLKLTPAIKVVQLIREKRKDIFAVAFKATTGYTPEQQYIAGLHLLKESSVNLVLANDSESHLNMIITPEEAKYSEFHDRNTALSNLVEMTLKRSHLTFTRSTVVAGDPIPWDSPLIPEALRTVVNHCINGGAYKPFRGATVGHFAAKLEENVFLTSIRKSNFNDLHKNGLVKIVTDGPDSVIAYGAKPSVGGQSQRIVFNDHQDCDCIVHFHCPIREGSKVPQVSQRDYECGSHECGRNTSNGLKRFSDGKNSLLAVYLQEHGPNIVFNRKTDPEFIIRFIEENFNLNEKTGGYVTLGQILKTPDTLEALQSLQFELENSVGKETKQSN